MDGDSIRTGGSELAAQPAGPGPVDDDRLQSLLIRTSRTFALAIPLLPQPTLREVTIAYLLFRIADTFEDASVLWGKARQLSALEEFGRLLGEPSVAAAERAAERWLEKPPSEHEGYMELLRSTPDVIHAYLELSEEARREIGRHTVRTTERMAGFVESTDSRGLLQLRNLEDLRAYCYAVAGIVGEMLTELFLLGRSHLEPVTSFLRSRAALFGEGLQLVNILKDSASDLTEGRSYIPGAVERADVFALARRDLDAAAEYATAIQEAGGPDEIVAFTALPIQLAWATLDRVERHGPGSKIGRDQVFSLYQGVLQALARSEPAVKPRGV